MKFTSTIIFLAAVLGVSAGTPTSVAYDTTYDTSSLSTLSIACSDGANGLHTKGYLTLGSLPRFPNVGAASDVAGWNSPQCGKCFKLYYKGRTVYITAVDAATGGTGFVLSKAAMNSLTGGLAEQLGRVTADYAPAASNLCGM